MRRLLACFLVAPEAEVGRSPQSGPSSQRGCFGRLPEIAEPSAMLELQPNQTFRDLRRVRGLAEWRAAATPELLSDTDDDARTH